MYTEYVVVIDGIPYSVGYTRYLLLKRGWWNPAGVSIAIIIKYFKPSLLEGGYIANPSPTSML